MDEIKQVVVFRRYYPHNKSPNKKVELRTGKIAAQCGHGFIGSYKESLDKNPAIVKQWESMGTKKIVVYVNTEDELFKIAHITSRFMIPHYIVWDEGLTEFKGVRTATCIGIGPYYSFGIDKITGELPLL